MIIKMIQNLENKMELQINSLEMRIEKVQERFNKELEENFLKSQLKMNNAESGVPVLMGSIFLTSPTQWEFQYLQKA